MLYISVRAAVEDHDGRIFGQSLYISLFSPTVTTGNYLQCFVSAFCANHAVRRRNRCLLHRSVWSERYSVAALFAPATVIKRLPLTFCQAPRHSAGGDSAMQDAGSRMQDVSFFENSIQIVFLAVKFKKIKKEDIIEQTFCQAPSTSGASNSLQQQQVCYNLFQSKELKSKSLHLLRKYFARPQYHNKMSTVNILPGLKSTGRRRQCESGRGKRDSECKFFLN